MLTHLFMIGRASSSQNEVLEVANYIYFDGSIATPSAWLSATQSTPANQPSIVQDSNNQVVDFESGDHFDYLDDAWASGDFELWFMVKADDGRPASQQTLFGNTNLKLTLESDGKLRFYYNSVIAESKYYVFEDGVTAWVLVRVIVNKTGNQISLEVNGIPLELDSTNDGDITGENYATGNGMQIGDTYTGRIGDILINNSLYSQIDSYTIRSYFI